jgi:DNA-directed RNA polymerase alpha subunit
MLTGDEYLKSLIGKPPSDPRDAMGINHLEVSARVYNALNRFRFIDVHQITAMNHRTIQNFPNLGKKSYQELREAIARLNMYWPENGNQS